ncbi:MAG: DnaD domain protein [Chloroflexi bacterium]|nr:DnaD domain protein [Chloroflexota bacterium]
MPFSGFPPGKVRLVPIPAPFFTQLLPEIDHLGEMKVVLYVFWRLSQSEAPVRYLTRADFLEDEAFMQGLAPSRSEAEAALDEALTRAVARGVLLAADIEDGESRQTLYFLNSPKGRAAADAVRAGQWRPSGDAAHPVHLYLDRPNIYRLYEEHIGPLTPLIAEQLQEAEAAYPADWIEEAFRIAAANNVRRWRYIEAILERWQKEGRHDRTLGGDSEKDRRRYYNDKFSDFYE